MAAASSLTGLPRQEALAAFKGIFGAELNRTSMGLDHFQPLAFRNDHVAVVARSAPLGESSQGLIDATFPLRVADQEGVAAPVDLGLESEDGSVSPTNSPVEVLIPSNLANGIEFPEIGMAVELGTHGSSAPSIDGNVAVYPDSGQNEDIAVAAVPTGVETFTEIRQEGEPAKQELTFDLPAGSSLTKDKSGAVLIERNGKPFASVSPASAIDAEGHNLPVSVELEGDGKIQIEAEPSPGTVYPILLDPLIQSYSWFYPNSRAGIETGSHGGGEEIATGSLELEGWVPEIVKSPSGYSGAFLANHVPGWPNGSPEGEVPRQSSGLYAFEGGNFNIAKPSGGIFTPAETVGAYSAWIYAVPRYFSDRANYGQPPESFISRLTLSQLWFQGFTNEPGLSPYLEAGIRTPGGTWLSTLVMPSQPGDSLENLGYEYRFPESGPNGNPEGKIASVGLADTEPDVTSGASLFVGAATIELSEPENSTPTLGTPLGAPGGWLHSAPVPIALSASDRALGVSAFRLTSGAKSWTTPYGCAGVAGSACPHMWKTTQAGEPQVYLNPAELPTGHDVVSVVAIDPVGHTSPAGQIEMKVDNTKPTVELEGSMLEEGRVGAHRPAYPLSITARDGTGNAPQSGVALVKVAVDNKVVAEEAPGCISGNCTQNLSWTMQSAQFSNGSHTVTVTAEDAAGNAAVKSFKVMLVHDAPTVTLSGTATEQGALGVTRPSYNLEIGATTDAGEMPLPARGSALTGAQLGSPDGIATGPNGEVWVADKTANHVVEYSATGQVLRTVTGGTGLTAPIVAPAGIAVSSGFVYVTTSALGGVLDKFTLQGSPVIYQGDGGGTPKSIAVDSEGGLWAATGSTLLKLTGPNGIQTISVPNAAPAYVAASSSEKALWVSSPNTHEIIKLNLEGKVLARVGEAGSGPGQLLEPRALDVNEAGTVWVADGANNRVSGFSREGEYAGSFGGPSSGEPLGYLEFENGIAIDKSSMYVESASKRSIVRWTQPVLPSSSRVEVQALVDGAMVAEKTATCTSSSCSVKLSTSIAQSAGPGPHKVVVRATDILGNVTEKQLSVEVEPDKARPVLAVSGALADAPGGWLAQEGYPLAVHAEDAGYGVTRLVFNVDGQQVAEDSHACSEGGCSLDLDRTIDTSQWSGGAHVAQVVAEDGAGNRTVREWQLNVDPTGQITASEVAATVEASDETSNSSVITPNSQLVEEGEGEVPALGDGITALESTGTPDVSLISKSADEGFAIGLPETTIEVTPVGTPNSSGTAQVAAEESVAVTPNTATGVDSVIRPVFNGLMDFEAIREPGSPSEFSWEVELWGGQSLKQVDADHAEIVYESGLVALMISTETAHDALGHEVPTSLTVTGPNVITLKVNHIGGAYVYPILAGAGWQGGTTTEYISHPMDRLELEEQKRQKEHEEMVREEENRAREQEELERHQAEGGSGSGSPYGAPWSIERTYPPEAVNANPQEEGAATGSSVKHQPFALKYEYELCAYDGPGGCVPWKLTTWSRFRYNGAAAWWPEHEVGFHPHCEESSHAANLSLKNCDWVGSNFQAYGAGRHISWQAIWKVDPAGVPAEFEEPVTVYAYGDGYVNGHNTKAICNPLSSCS